MPLVTAGLTLLALSGAPGRGDFIPTAKTLDVSSPVATTFLTLGGGPGRRTYSPEYGRTISSLLAVTASDTLSFSATESPTDRNELTTYDTLSLRFSTELATLLNFYQASDTATLTIAESVSLNQAGVFARTASDTLSLSVSESATVAVRIATTDTLSMSGNDGGGTVAIGTAVLTSTDDAALSVNDAAAVTIFSGSIGINVSDVGSLQVTESAAIQIPSTVTSIRIQAKVPRIAFRRI